MANATSMLLSGAGFAGFVAWRYRDKKLPKHETNSFILLQRGRAKVEEELLQGNNSENGFFKVYVRQRAHLEEIKDELKEHLRDNHKVIFFGRWYLSERAPS
jgi:hypothetical protein